MAESASQPDAGAAAVDALAATLRAAVPASVAALPDDVVRRLVAQIEAGRTRHDRAGMKAIDDALRGVPVPFRGLVRKALR